MKILKNFITFLLIISISVLASNYDEAVQTQASVKRTSVALSGQSFGIKLFTKGVLVISPAEVQTEQGVKNPAADVGVMAGDIITAVNGKKVTTCAEVSSAFEDSEGKSVIISIKRGEEEKSVSITPVLSSSTGTYKAGLWIRDSSAGIGTITYYDKSGNFAALGHGICDVDTATLMPLLEGEAVESKIIGFSAAEKGKAGELYGVLGNKTIGKIKINCEKGVYGTGNDDVSSLKFVETALPNEIKRGEAKLLTVIDEDGVKEFDVEIVFLSKLGTGNKDMIVKITDEELLNKTGGILQGMSGSPIIQDGKFVGALTHVFLNKPNYGYAVFGYSMTKISNSLN